MSSERRLATAVSFFQIVEPRKSFSTVARVNPHESTFVVVVFPSEIPSSTLSTPSPSSSSTLLDCGDYCSQYAILTVKTLVKYYDCPVIEL